MTRMRRDYLMDSWIMKICFVTAVALLGVSLVSLWSERWGPGVVLLILSALNWWFALVAARRVEAAQAFRMTGE